MKNITCNYACSGCIHSPPVVRYICTDKNITCNNDCANCTKSDKCTTYTCRKIKYPFI